MATGRPAFAERTFPELIAAILHSQPAAPSMVNPLVPRKFDRLVAKAMAKRPRQRYQSAAEVANALSRIAGARTTSAVLRGAPQRLARAAQTTAVLDKRSA
jgi:serine/threonine-protein kinase